MMILNNNIYIFSILLILGCAHQGLPKGGPKDDVGPILMNTNPNNMNNLSSNQKIVIIFDEYIDPNSIIKSINIKPKIDVIIKARKNKIIIKPIDSWPDKETVEINLLRSITDLQSNKIDNNIQLIYNLKSDTHECLITGLLHNSRKDKLYNILLYEWPLDISQLPIKKIHADKNHHFKIEYLDYGKYVLIVSEGNLNIYNNYYGVSSYEYIELNQQNRQNNLYIYIDEPLKKNKIIRVETINNNFLNIYFDDNIIQPYTLDDNINIGDSIYINLKGSNRLENYEIDSYLYIVKDKLDTIPPLVKSIENYNFETTIKFSEPIMSDNIIILGKKEDDWVNINYDMNSHNSIILNSKNISEVKLFGNSVVDLYGNKMLDSLNVFEVTHIVENDVKNTGFLKGKILNKLGENIIVEAKNISLNLLYHKKVKDSIFIFNNLSSGKYIFRAYEEKNKINPLVYFSGTLEPYHPSAHFTVYKDTIEVRKYWDIEGINIEF